MYDITRIIKNIGEKYVKKRKKQIRMTKVFIPGGFPTVTYIARKEKQLEERVSATQDFLAKLVVVTGATKSGKTVLVDKVFPQNSSIWIDGGAIGDENSFWELIVEKANLFTEKEYVEHDMESSTIEAEGSVEGNIFVTKGSATAKVSLGVENTFGKNFKRTITSKVAAIHMLQSEEIPLIVDDFHYIDKKFKKV